MFGRTFGGLDFRKETTEPMQFILRSLLLGERLFITLRQRNSCISATIQKNVIPPKAGAEPSPGINSLYSTCEADINLNKRNYRHRSEPDKISAAYSGQTQSISTPDLMQFAVVRCNSSLAGREGNVKLYIYTSYLMSLWEN